VEQNCAVDRFGVKVAPQWAQGMTVGVVTSPFARRRRLAASLAIARS